MIKNSIQLLYDHNLNITKKENDSQSKSKIARYFYDILNHNKNNYDIHQKGTWTGD